jgi:hypothetical protein
MCRQGASVIQSAVLHAISDPSVRAYVAWVPILPHDTDAPDEETRALVPDERATHFWDAEGNLPGLFHSVLQLPADYPAWDVYLVYPPGARWDTEPPAPSYWQHQLGDLPNAPLLDGPSLAAQLRSILAEQSRRAT